MKELLESIDSVAEVRRAYLKLLRHQLEGAEVDVRRVLDDPRSSTMAGPVRDQYLDSLGQTTRALDRLTKIEQKFEDVISRLRLEIYSGNFFDMDSLVSLITDTKTTGTEYIS